MDLVGAAAVRDVHGRARRAAVLGALVVRDDAELADRVGRRLHHLVREALVAGAVGVVVDAVDQEVVERAAQAVDVERAFARRALIALVQGRLPHAGREQRQCRILAAVQRQLPHLLAGNHLAALAGVGFEQGRGGGDDHPSPSAVRPPSADRPVAARRPAPARRPRARSRSRSSRPSRGRRRSGPRRIHRCRRPSWSASATRRWRCWSA